MIIVIVIVIVIVWHGRCKQWVIKKSRAGGPLPMLFDGWLTFFDAARIMRHLYSQSPSVVFATV